MKSAGELILYKDFNGTDEEIFYPMASIIERSRRGGMDAKEECRSSTSVFIDC